MGSSCIIADNAAQFTKVNFPENIDFRFIEFKTEFFLPGSKEKGRSLNNPFPNQLPLSRKSLLTPPTELSILELISNCINQFDDVFIILHSKEMNSIYNMFTEVLTKVHGRASVHLIDSQSLSIGQGFIIQYASDLISKRIPGDLIEQKLREVIPHIYTLICTPNLSYLHSSGFIDDGQCIVGEMSSLLPIFCIEEGKLNPLDKVKNIHSVIDYFISFIEEFERIYQIAFLHPVPSLFSESKIVKQFLEENYSSTLYSEHPVNSFMASMFGPKGFGMTIIEKSS